LSHVAVGHGQPAVLPGLDGVLRPQAERRQGAQAGDAGPCPPPPQHFLGHDLRQRVLSLFSSRHCCGLTTRLGTSFAKAEDRTVACMPDMTAGGLRTRRKAQDRKETATPPATTATDGAGLTHRKRLTTARRAGTAFATPFATTRRRTRTRRSHTRQRHSRMPGTAACGRIPAHAPAVAACLIEKAPDCRSPRESL